jgi:hypothetical protein
VHQMLCAIRADDRRKFPCIKPHTMALVAYINLDVAFRNCA